MATPVNDLIRWLNTLPKDAQVGIDDGGLALEVVNDPSTYLEIGGIPNPDEDDPDEDTIQ